MALNNAIPELDVYQWGKETTRGTLVAATEKIAIARMDVDEAGVRYLPQYQKGVLLANRGNELVVSRQTTFEIPNTAFNYEQHHRVLGMALKGGVTPTGSNPYTWAFPRSLTADPNPDSYTIERRQSDGSTNEDIEFGYALLSQLRYAFAQNTAFQWGATGFGRKVQSSTLTAALTLPTPEIPPSPLFTIFMDPTFAALGSTQLATQVVGGEIVIDTGFMPYVTHDGRTDLDYATHVLNVENVKATVTIQCLMKMGQLATERAAAAAQTLRAMRFRVAGSASRQFTLDLLLKYTKPDILAREISDGQNVVTLEMETSTDNSNPSITATLINTIAA